MMLLDRNEAIRKRLMILQGFGLPPRIASMLIEDLNRNADEFYKTAREFACQRAQALTVVEKGEEKCRHQ